MRSLIASFALTLMIGLPLQADTKVDAKTDTKTAGNASIQWAPFTQGLKSAATSKKYVLVDVYTQWCGYCKQLDAVTFKASPVIAELDKHFISVKMDAESDEPLVWKNSKTSGRDLANRWDIDGFPTMMFLNSKGEIIGSYSSYADPDMMVKLLTYISSGARERKISFEDYLKKS